MILAKLKRFFFLFFVFNSVKFQIGAFFAGFTIAWEEESRRSEIALFIMPRFFETAWNFLKRRNLVKPIPGGELIIFAFTMGIINYFYQMEVSLSKYLKGNRHKTHLPELI